MESAFDSTTDSPKPKLDATIERYKVIKIMSVKGEPHAEIIDLKDGSHHTVNAGDKLGKLRVLFIDFAEKTVDLKSEEGQFTTLKLLEFDKSAQ